MKEFRRLTWSKSKAFVQIRISELIQLGIKQKQKYKYSIKPIEADKTLIVQLKKDR